MTTQDTIPQKLETMKPRWGVQFDRRLPLRVIRGPVKLTTNGQEHTFETGELFDWIGLGLQPRIPLRLYNQKIVRHVAEDRKFGPVRSQRRAEQAARAEEDRIRNEMIVEILDTLDPEDDSNWDEAGLPSLEAVAEFGEEFTREQIEAAAPGFTRDKALEKWVADDAEETDPEGDADASAAEVDGQGQETDATADAQSDAGAGDGEGAGDAKAATEGDADAQPKAEEAPKNFSKKKKGHV